MVLALHCWPLLRSVAHGLVLLLPASMSSAIRRQPLLRSGALSYDRPRPLACLRLYVVGLRDALYRHPPLCSTVHDFRSPFLFFGKHAVRSALLASATICCSWSYTTAHGRRHTFGSTPSSSTTLLFIRFIPLATIGTPPVLHCWPPLQSFIHGPSHRLPSSLTGWIHIKYTNIHFQRTFPSTTPAPDHQSHCLAYSGFVCYRGGVRMIFIA